MTKTEQVNQREDLARLNGFIADGQLGVGGAKWLADRQVAPPVGEPLKGGCLVENG